MQGMEQRSWCLVSDRIPWKAEAEGLPDGCCVILCNISQVLEAITDRFADQQGWRPWLEGDDLRPLLLPLLAVISSVSRGMTLGTCSTYHFHIPHTSISRPQGPDRS